MDYKNTTSYKHSKLASKQADRLFRELISDEMKKADREQCQSFYQKWHKSYLYKNFSNLYCDVLTDAAYWVKGVR